MGRQEKANTRKGMNRLIGSLITMAVVIAAVFAAMAGSAFMAGESLFSNEIFPEGANVDGIDLSGMTYGDAFARVAAKRQEELENVSVKLNYAGREVEFTAKELGLSYNIDYALSGAYYIRPDGGEFMDELVHNIETVFGPKPGVERKTVLAYDPEAIKETVEKALRPLDTPPSDAKISGVAFHKDGVTFTYEKEIPGMRAHTEEAAEAVLQSLASSGGAPVIDVGYDAISASVTEQKLRANTMLVSEFSTELNDNENRNVNIELMCKAVDGFILQPGATMSVNGIAGRRTAEKGYMSAPAIIDGAIEEEVGGGICQLSGTLYNAALLADMQIVERKRHSYPSEYLPIGLDSTLDWNDKDLKLKNVTDYPIYVSANMDRAAKTVTVKLYGKPLTEGSGIEILPQVIKEIEPPGQQIQIKPNMAAGERRIVQKAVHGYEVKVYRNHYDEDELVYSELISHDFYDTREAIVWIGAEDENK